MSDDSLVVVLLHPLGGDAEFWSPLIDELSSVSCPVRTVAINLPGHGHAALPAVGATIEDFSASVLEQLDELGLSLVDIVGMSLGGMVAQDIAARYPQRVRRLVLVGTVPTYPPEMKAMWTSRAASVRSEGLDGVASLTQGLWFTDEFLGHPVAGRALRTLLETPREAYARTCEALAGADLTGQTSQVSAPTLIVCGDTDAPAFRHAATWFRDSVADAELSWIPGRHAAVVERPDLFARLLVDFLLSA